MSQGEDKPRCSGEPSPYLEALRQYAARKAKKSEGEAKGVGDKWFFLREEDVSRICSDPVSPAALCKHFSEEQVKAFLTELDLRCAFWAGDVPWIDGQRQVLKEELKQPLQKAERRLQKAIEAYDEHMRAIYETYVAILERTLRKKISDYTFDDFKNGDSLARYMCQQQWQIMDMLLGAASALEMEIEHVKSMRAKSKPFERRRVPSAVASVFNEYLAQPTTTVNGPFEHVLRVVLERFGLSPDIDLSHEIRDAVKEIKELHNIR